MDSLNLWNGPAPTKFNFQTIARLEDPRQEQTCKVTFNQFNKLSQIVKFIDLLA